MSADAVAKLGLGRKYDASYSTKAVGQTAVFADLDRSKTPFQTLSGAMVEARLCRSSSATALKPGSKVKYVEAPGVVTGAVAADQPAGVVDPWLNADVAQDEIFWVIFAGPAKVLSGAAYAINVPLISDGSGRAVTAAVDHTTYARSIELAGAADQLKRAYISCPRIC